jgi:tetratricopeptide (TPR) repeat protein
MASAAEAEASKWQSDWKRLHEVGKGRDDGNRVKRGMAKSRSGNGRAASRWCWRAAVALAGLLLLALAGKVAAPAGAQESGSKKFTLRVNPGDEATEAGFFHFYNMEYAEAIRDFENSLAKHPGSPYAVNHLLEAVLFQELHREGKLDAQLYLSNQFVQFKKVDPDPKVVERIEELQERAAKLENERLAGNPNDAETLYARSVTRGLRATKQALIGKQWFAALRSGLGAYDDSKQVLELDPQNSNAKLIVGIYNYVVGSLPWPVKIAALLAAIHGSKTKGLELMREAAAGDGEASVDARTTLALFLAREQQYPEAEKLLDWLYRMFPRNFLYGLSDANLQKASGKKAEAIASYRRLIVLAKQGEFPGQHVDWAAVNLGDTLREESDWRGAAKAYDTGATLPDTDPEMVGRVRLAAGQMYDMLGERTTALERYRQALKASESEDLIRQARQGLKKPYKGK